MFQSVVKRNYTPGFVGEMSNDSPYRARSARIVSDGVTGGPNRIGRAFGWAGNVPATGTTLAADEITVEVGGNVFAGVLVNPKHYVLNGTQAGGPLAASYDLPQYAEGEFMDMGIIFAELFNETDATKAVAFGDGLAYVAEATTALQNPNGLPLGAIISFTPGAAPAGYVVIPNGRVANDISLAASGVGAVVSGTTKIQLTQ